MRTKICRNWWNGWWYLRGSLPPLQSICVRWLCYVKQEEWPPRDMREEKKKKRETAGASSSLGLPFPLVTLEVLSLCLLALFFLVKSSSLLYMYRRTACVVFWHCLALCRKWAGGGGGFIMSRERVMVCAGHLLVISRSAHPGVLFNK